MTFKNATGLRNALTVTPLDRTCWSRPTRPTSPRRRYRGATNASFLVPLTVRAMAGVLNVDMPTLCRAVSDNSERVYGPGTLRDTGPAVRH